MPHAGLQNFGVHEQPCSARDKNVPRRLSISCKDKVAGRRWDTHPLPANVCDLVSSHSSVNLLN